MIINLLDLAIKSQEPMEKKKEYIEGVKFAMDCIKSNKTYNGNYLECIQYLNNKVQLATINMCHDDNKMLYCGCIALYSSMIETLIIKIQDNE